MTKYHAQLQSTALSSADYDDEIEQLQITFVSGSTYTFERVPMTVFEELRDSPSPGSFYHQSIKNSY